jgi:uncharacterized protein YbjT (DUF2867 family)
MKIVVIGGGGLIGRGLVKRLRERGHEAVAASRSSGVDAVTGTGLPAALTGARVVVDVTNSPSFEDAAVLAFFEASSRNLLAAGARPGWGTTSPYRWLAPTASPTAATCGRRWPRSG